MILGIGNDLCDIRRIEKSLDRYGDRFVERVFTDAERERAERHPNQRAASYAKRFAAKEAFAKALGTGIAHGVFLKDIAVVNLASGKPTLALANGAADQLARLVPPGMVARIDLSMTDEYPLAQAMVVLSALPGGMQP